MRADLHVERLSVDRGGRPVLRNLSFRLAAGEAMVVTGSNGAGKSTLLRAIAGLIPQVDGLVRLASFRPGESSHGEESLDATRSESDLDLAEHTHYLGHANGLKLALSAAENLRFAAAWGGTDGIEPTAALARVDLAHVAGFPVGMLSAGQRRRVALARLLVARRSLWLLDEPTAALDAASEATLVRLVADHLAFGGVVMAALHAPLGFPARSLRLGAA